MSYGDEEALPYMYGVIEYMASKGYPIVFKGALVLKVVLENYSKLNTSRLTEDIDGDWGKVDVTNDQLLAAIREAVASLGDPQLTVEQYRLFSKSRGAGFHVNKVYPNGEDILFFSLDIAVNKNNFYTVYRTKNGVEFRGSSIYRILADKIQVVSSQLVRRRVKDLYDIYLISHFDGIQLSEILNTIHSLGYSLNDFNTFLTKDATKQSVEHAYNKLEGVQNKPSYENVYHHVERFLKPFIYGYDKDIDAVWTLTDEGHYEWLTIGDGK